MKKQKKMVIYGQTFAIPVIVCCMMLLVLRRENLSMARFDEILKHGAHRENPEVLKPRLQVQSIKITYRTTVCL